MNEQDQQEIEKLRATLDPSLHGLLDLCIEMEDITADALQEAYHDIRESFELAMTAAFGEDDRIQEILTTVDDAVSNHWDDLMDRFVLE